MRAGLHVIASVHGLHNSFSACFVVLSDSQQSWRGESLPVDNYLHAVHVCCVQARARKRGHVACKPQSVGQPYNLRHSLAATDTGWQAD